MLSGVSRTSMAKGTLDDLAPQFALAERYAPAGANKGLSAVKGVLRAAWRLGQLPDGDYLRAIDVDHIRGSSAPVGRAVELDELALMLKACARSTRARAG